MRPLNILILSDGRPGHYHLADGVAAAIGRRRTVAIEHRLLARRRRTPGRLLAAALRLGLSPAWVLANGYAIARASLPPADVVISAGGDTLAANVAASRLLGARNIFCGTLRHLPASAFSLIVSSYARHRTLAHHLVALKPNGIDPDTLPHRPMSAPLGPAHAPGVAGLLVGGPSGLFDWHDREWARLLDFLSLSHSANRIRWIVSTSRRTPDGVADRLQALSRQPESAIAELIDFRVAGPGTLPHLFGAVEAILATEDSSTMLSEAVCARLPVVGVAPARHGFKNEEREYRAYLMEQGWCRSLGIEALAPATFLAALGSVTPLSENHLDRLADALRERLPDLFATIPA